MPTTKKPSTKTTDRAPRAKKSEPTVEQASAEAEPQQPAAPTEAPAAEDELALNDDQPISAEAFAEREAQRAERQYTKTKLTKLAREKVWGILARKHGLPLSRPGTTDEGARLSTTDEGNGMVLVTHRTNTGDPSVIDERVQHYHTLLAAEGLPVSLVNIDGRPYLKIPVTRTPNAPDAPKAKKSYDAATTALLATAQAAAAKTIEAFAGRPASTADDIDAVIAYFNDQLHHALVAYFRDRLASDINPADETEISE